MIDIFHLGSFAGTCDPRATAASSRLSSMGHLWDRASKRSELKKQRKIVKDWKEGSDKAPEHRRREETLGDSYTTGRVLVFGRITANAE